MWPTLTLMQGIPEMLNKNSPVIADTVGYPEMCYKDSPVFISTLGNPETFDLLTIAMTKIDEQYQQR